MSTQSMLSCPYIACQKCCRPCVFTSNLGKPQRSNGKAHQRAMAYQSRSLMLVICAHPLLSPAPCATCPTVDKPASRSKEHVSQADIVVITAGPACNEPRRAAPHLTSAALSLAMACASCSARCAASSSATAASTAARAWSSLARSLEAARCLALASFSAPLYRSQHSPIKGLVSAIAEVSPGRTPAHHHSEPVYV